MSQRLTHQIKPRHWTHWVAVGLGSGLAPKAPGTYGTLAALPLVLAAHYFLAVAVYAIFIVLLFGLAVYCAQRTQQDWQCHDPGAIVIDEWVGLAVSYFLVPATPLNGLLGLLLFRFFDIVKPWPIRWLDTHLKGGLGNVLDDVVAGIFTCVVLHCYLLFA